MADRATPNLPSRDLVATSQFYARLGFRETFRDEGWLIVERGPLQIEFFPSADHNPRKNLASCCIRVSDLNLLHEAFMGAGLPTSHRDVPRITSPVDQPWGLVSISRVWKRVPIRRGPPHAPSPSVRSSSIARLQQRSYPNRQHRRHLGSGLRYPWREPGVDD